MKRSVKIMLLVCLLLFVCGGYYLVPRLNTAAEVNESAGSFVLISRSEEEVAGLKWTWEDMDWELTCTDGTWQKADSSAFPLNQSSAKTMAEAVATLYATRKLEDVANLADYGLADPAFEITVTWTDGTSTTLTMGDATPFDDGYYLQTSNDPEAIYTIEDSLSTSFEKTEADMAVFDSVPELEGATHLVIGEVLDASLTSESAELDGGAHWYLSDGRLLDTESVESLLDILSGLSWEDLVSADASDELLTEKQLTDDTAAIITVSSEEDELMKVYFGTTDEESGDYYARLSGSRMIYTVSSSTVFSLLSVNVDDLRPDTLLDVALDDMAKVVYGTEGITWISIPVEMAAVETGSEEAAEAGEADETGEAATEPEMAFTEMDETLWNALTALTMDGYVTDEQPGNLLLTLELTAKNGNTATMTISEQSVDSYYLVMTGRDDCLISADGVDKLLRTLRNAE